MFLPAESESIYVIRDLNEIYTQTKDSAIELWQIISEQNG
jgi:hypothetical protein